MDNSTMFDDLDGSNADTKKPFFAIDHDNDDEVLNWLKDELAAIKNDSTMRLEKIRNNYLRYKGIQYQNQVYQPRAVPESPKKYMPQLVVPLISDAVDEKVARLLEYKPAIVVVPEHDEQRDKEDAKNAKKFLDSVAEAQGLDQKFYKLTKNSKIAGESFHWIRWNPDLGDPIKVNPAQTSEGQPIQELVTNGDCEVKLMTPNWLFYQRTQKWEDVDFCYMIEPEYTEALKIDYPDHAGDISTDANAGIFDYQNMQEKQLSGMTFKITFYHRRTKYLPQGYEAVYVNGALLKKGPLSYEHGKLPIVRLIDQENEEEVAGESFIERVRAIASQVSNSVNSVIKQLMLAGWAKWFVEAESIDEQQLNNDVSIVKVRKGSNKPILSQANPVSPQTFEFIQQLKDMFYQFAKSNSVVQGDPPKGVTAFVALQFLSESENRRINTDIVNLNTAVRETYQMILDVCGQFYKPTDQRTMQILGKDNRWENLPFDPTTISKPYAVKIQNTSALPDSKAVRTQMILDLSKERPNMLPDSQVSEMLELGQADKFQSVQAAASRAAEDENEYMQDGKGLLEPMVYEDLITHWNVHVMSIQSLGFKQKASPDIQKSMADHIMATEQLMMEQALKSSAYAQMINMHCPQFPMYLDPNMPPSPDQMALAQQQAQAQGQAAAVMQHQHAQDSSEQSLRNLASNASPVGEKTPPPKENSPRPPATGEE